jgi:hypothetical protein
MPNIKLMIIPLATYQTSTYWFLSLWYSLIYFFTMEWRSMTRSFTLTCLLYFNIETRSINIYDTHSQCYMVVNMPQAWCILFFLSTHFLTIITHWIIIPVQWGQRSHTYGTGGFKERDINWTCFNIEIPNFTKVLVCSYSVVLCVVS